MARPFFTPAFGLLHRARSGNSNVADQLRGNEAALPFVSLNKPKLSRIPMSAVDRYKSQDFKKVLDRFATQLRFRISQEKIAAVCVELSMPRPDREVCTHIQELLDKTLQNKLVTLCDQFSERFQKEPTYADLGSALEAAGYTYTRTFLRILHTVMKEKNDHRWVPPTKRKAVRLTDGEYALCAAIERTFDKKPEEIVPMLLRVFAVATGTGKINLLDIPYVTEPITDKHLETFAKSLNFKI